TERVKDVITDQRVVLGQVVRRARELQVVQDERPDLLLRVVHVLPLPSMASASRRRSIFPVPVFGSTSRKWNASGIMYFGMRRAQNAARSGAPSSSRATTYAAMRFVMSSSGTATTAHSTTAGCAYSAASTSPSSMR